MKFNSETLVEHCNLHNITLLKTYEKINRETYIEGKCIYENCDNSFHKNFRQLVKTGAYCVDCMNIVAKIKIREKNVKFNNELLNEFCNENNMLLIKDYSNQERLLNILHKNKL